MAETHRVSDEHAPFIRREEQRYYDQPQNNIRKKILKGSFYVLTFSMAVLAVALSSITVTLQLSQNNSITIPVKYTTYERIGYKECPKGQDVEKIYDGITVSYNTSSHYTGFRCMSTNESYIKYHGISNYTSTEQIIFGKVAEYKTFTKANDHNAACVVCRVKGRGSIMILPGTFECLVSWTMEYSGYLMTGNTCVDTNMTTIASTRIYNGGPTLRHEVATSEIYNEYDEYKVLSCVVCSK